MQLINRIIILSFKQMKMMTITTVAGVENISHSKQMCKKMINYRNLSSNLLMRAMEEIIGVFVKNNKINRRNKYSSKNRHNYK